MTTLNDLIADANESDEQVMRILAELWEAVIADEKENSK